MPDTPGPREALVNAIAESVINTGFALEDGSHAVARARYERIIKAARERAEGVPDFLAEENRSRYVIENDGAGSVTARIFGIMDRWWDFDDKAFMRELDQQGEMSALRILVDSPGGSVWSGLALYRDLARRRAEGVTVSTEAAGLVASAATLPFVAGETRTGGPGSLFMIHESWGLLMAAGNLADVDRAYTKWRNAMGAANKAMASIYRAAIALDADQVKEAMAAETWYDPDEALEAGILTAIDEGVESAGDGGNALALSAEESARVQAILQSHRP